MNHILNYTAIADINLTNTGHTLILYNSKILNSRKPLILYTDHDDGQCQIQLASSLYRRGFKGSATLVLSKIIHSAIIKIPHKRKGFRKVGTMLLFFQRSSESQMAISCMHLIPKPFYNDNIHHQIDSKRNYSQCGQTTEHTFYFLCV